MEPSRTKHCSHTETILTPFRLNHQAGVALSTRRCSHQQPLCSPLDSGAVGAGQVLVGGARLGRLGTQECTGIF